MLFRSFFFVSQSRYKRGYGKDHAKLIDKAAHDITQHTEKYPKSTLHHVDTSHIHKDIENKEKELDNHADHHLGEMKKHEGFYLEKLRGSKSIEHFHKEYDNHPSVIAYKHHEDQYMRAKRAKSALFYHKQAIDNPKAFSSYFHSHNKKKSLKHEDGSKHYIVGKVADADNMEMPSGVKHVKANNAAHAWEKINKGELAGKKL